MSASESQFKNEEMSNFFYCRIHPKEHFKQMYEVDEVYYTDEVNLTLLENCSWNSPVSQEKEP